MHTYNHRFPPKLARSFTRSFDISNQQLPPLFLFSFFPYIFYKPFFSQKPHNSRPDRDILRFAKPENRGIRKDFIKVSVFNFPGTYTTILLKWTKQTLVCARQREPIVEETHEQRPGWQREAFSRDLKGKIGGGGYTIQWSARFKLNFNYSTPPSCFRRE